MRIDTSLGRQPMGAAEGTPSPAPSACSPLRAHNRANSVSSQAADELVYRNELCKFDYYSYVGPSPHSYEKVVKNTLPKSMRTFFKPSTERFVAPPTVDLRFDLSVFQLVASSDVDGALAAREIPVVHIESAFASELFASVEWLHTGFAVLIRPPAQSSKQPFTEAKFLQAVFAAKWLLELNFMPDLFDPGDFSDDDIYSSSASKRSGSLISLEDVGMPKESKKLRKDFRPRTLSL